MSADSETGETGRLRTIARYVRAHGIRDALARLIGVGTVDRLDDPTLTNQEFARVRDETTVDGLLLDCSTPMGNISIEYVDLSSGIWYNVYGEAVDRWTIPLRFDVEDTHVGGVILSGAADPAQARADVADILGAFDADLTDCTTARLRQLRL